MQIGLELPGETRFFLTFIYRITFSLCFRLMDRKKDIVANKQNMIDVFYTKDAGANQKGTRRLIL